MAATTQNTLTKVKKRKFSKNKKKSWRKVDITDVEEYLEDERLQQRTGGLVAEKSDDQLFYVDKAVPEVIAGTSEPAESAATRRKRNAQRHLVEAEENLKVESVRIKPVRSTNVLKKLASGKKSLVERSAEKQRHSAIERRTERRREKKALPVVECDLWTDFNTEVKEDPHFLAVTKKRRVKPPRHYHEETSRVAKVTVPHPGASYNPAYDDHQELLWKAHKIEEKKVFEEKRLYKSLDAKFPSTEQAPTQESVLEEMSAGLFDTESDDEDTGGDMDRLSVNPPVRREDKKDERRRKMEKQKLLQEKKTKKEKSKKSRERNVFRLKIIKTEIKERETELKRRANRKRKLAEEEPYRTKKLGKMKFEEPDIELKLSEELVGSLRHLKPEGNLLEDRFKSLQKRNILEPRLTAKKSKRYRPKQFEKKGHREITL